MFVIFLFLSLSRSHTQAHTLCVLLSLVLCLVLLKNVSASIRLRVLSQSQKPWKRHKIPNTIKSYPINGNCYKEFECVCGLSVWEKLRWNSLYFSTWFAWDLYTLRSSVCVRFCECVSFLVFLAYLPCEPFMSRTPNMENYHTISDYPSQTKNRNRTG